MPQLNPTPAVVCCSLLPAPAPQPKAAQRRARPTALVALRPDLHTAASGLRRLRLADDVREPHRINHAGRVVSRPFRAALPRARWLHSHCRLYGFIGGKCQITTRKCLPTNQHNVVRAFAAKKNGRTRRNSQKKFKGPTFISEEASLGSNDNPTTSLEPQDDNIAANEQFEGAPRSAVLQACIATSALLLTISLILRQVLHFASLNGWPIPDPTKVTFDFEIWHLELIAGLVILISSSRYILLQTWSDFADSSEAANRQILTSLEPLDYIAVAFFPGISEELLFRGVLMPTFGLNGISALITGAIFGVLHLGSGRRYSFAIWATFVGFVYGMATIASSSLIVPMASHSINNLIGGLLWRYSESSQEKHK